MNKERIKSFILILLILNSIQLTVQLWFDSNLWPSGDGFVESFKKSSVFSNFADFFDKGVDELEGEQLYSQTVKPRRVVVNGGGAREVYIKKTDYYNDAMQFVEVILSDLNSENVTVSEITYEDWRNLFKAKSLYVDYGYMLDGDNLNTLYGINSSSGKFKNIQNFTGFIITPDTVTKSCSVCVLDEVTNKVTQHKFASDGSGLLDFISDCTYQKQQNDTFAFEINLDTATSSEDEVERQVAFSPLALLTIPTEFEKESVIQSEEIFEDTAEFESFAERALYVFGYKGSSLRKSVQSDGTITFVENKATIKFHNNGVIEYSAVSSESGLKMSDGDTGNYQAVCDVLNVVREVWRATEKNIKIPDFQLASDLMDNKDDKYTVKIDNSYNGIPVNCPDVIGNAVYAEVEKGYITKLIINISNIVETEQKKETVPVQMAIDALYEQKGNAEIIIEDVYKCYDFEDDGKAFVKWMFEVRGSDENIVVDSSDL